MSATDLHLTGRRASVQTAATAELIYSPYGVKGTDGRDHILLDASAANPAGRGPRQDLRGGVLTLATGERGDVWWRIHSAERGTTLVAAGRATDPLDGAHRTALHRLGLVTMADGSGETPDAAHASVLAQLAMTGVLVHARHVPDGVATRLSPELVSLIQAPPPGPKADPIVGELRSVALRRAALRGHSAGLVVLDALVGTNAALPAVTALLLSRRPGRVGRAVADLVAQTYPNLEIIVALHGVELEAGQRAQLTRADVPVEVLNLPADLTLGEALAAATRAAKGTLITKVDDDDRYGPEHVWDLVLARHYSGATVVGKPAEFVHLEAYDATVRRRMAIELYSDVISGATILIGRGDLENVGGWRPLPRSVDRALLDRVLQAGGLIYRTHGFGFICTRHNDQHTWDPDLRYFLLNPLRHWPGMPPFAEFGSVAATSDRHDE